jgi:flagellar L-ring protein precursor FlgH
LRRGWSAAAAVAQGPSSSLFGSPQRRQALTLAEYSWTYPKEVDEVRLNDLITVIVDEKSAVISEGEMDRKKKAHGDLILKDWILLKGLAAIPDPQTLGDPHIRGEVDNKMRSEAGLETRDSMKFRIACRVADIRPNGNLVIEGRRTVRNNLEVWEQSLTGEVRPKDVLPNNTVLSENVADLRIEKREAGHVRDGYRRGWLLRWLDRWQPF